MNSPKGNYTKEEELCIHRYQKSCRALEEKQDEVRKQKAALEHTSERMLAHVLEMHEHLECSAVSCDREDYQRITTSQSELFVAHSHAQQSLAECQEELAQRERKLTAERDALDQTYKQELRTLSDKGQEQDTSPMNTI